MAQNCETVKLFKMEIRTKKKSRALDVLVHADSLEQATAHVRARFPKCEIINPLELSAVPKHFVIAEYE